MKSTTFGWRLFNQSYKPTAKDKELVERLKSHVYKLSEEIGDRSVFNYNKLKSSADYITTQFKNLGLDVQFQEYFLYNKATRNIIATKKGKADTNKTIIIGAHYDTCFNPGADDNASSVAVVLELARVLAEQELNLNIKFISFVNEEPPFFKTDQMGSFVYVKEARERGEDIKAVVILESVGFYSNRLFSQRYPPFFGFFFPNRANFIAIVGNFSSRWLVKKIKSDFKKNSNFPIESLVTLGFVPGVDFSDHWSFWKNGYSAVMITDTAFYRYPHYHKSTDTYEKLNYQNMAALVKGLEYVLLELAKGNK